MIAMMPEDLEQGGYCDTYTHCEIHPAMILGEIIDLLIVFWRGTVCDTVLAKISGDIID